MDMDEQQLKAPRRHPAAPDFSKMDRHHLVSKREVCLYLGISVSKLDRLRRTNGAFPKPMQIGPRSQRWQFGELQDWVESQKRKGAR